MSDLGTVERAWADGYAAAQHEIDRLRAALERIAESRVDPEGYVRIASDALAKEGK